MRQSIFKPVCFIVIAMFAASIIFTASVEAQRRPVARGAAGGALGGAAVGSLSGGSAGKGAAWGAGIGAVRGLAEKDRMEQEDRIREMEKRDAYEQGRRDGQRVNYKDENTRKHVDGAAY